MAKYTNTAGFKAISNENTEEPNEKLPRALLFLIIGGIVVVVFIVFLMIHAVAANHSATATADEAMTIAVTTESYDYNELFGVSESTSASEPATVKLQNSTVNIEIPAPREETQPTTAAPQRSEAGTTTPRETETQESRNESSAPQESRSEAQSAQQSSAQGSRQSPQQNPISGDSGSSEVYVTEISLSQSGLSLTVGQSFTLSASVSPSNATNKSVTWTSSNSAVATVNRGVVKAQKAGTAMIYAVSSNGKKASCLVTVTEKQSAASSVSLSPGDTTIKVGQQLTIKLNGASKCEWSESNPFVVKMLSKGNDYYTIKGAKKGVTNIVATLPNGQSCKMKITVEK